eukprot:TRINITY_DN31586_c0_g1_i1.p1 TRINITY_DN31586_c0_g1~~TRINITY_DN31586_c0_g1_i1.p1  ORF type:complete len:682 (+),score=159.34 TRINITY_DN31586_c0_g1_i1:288-2048(+)
MEQKDTEDKYVEVEQSSDFPGASPNGDLSLIDFEDEAVECPDSLSPAPSSPPAPFRRFSTPQESLSDQSSIGNKIKNEQQAVDTLVQNIEALIEERDTDQPTTTREASLRQYECRVHDKMLAAADEENKALLNRHRELQDAYETYRVEREVAFDSIKQGNAVLTNLNETLQAQHNVAMTKIDSLTMQLSQYRHLEEDHAALVRTCDGLKIREASTQAERDVLRGDLGTTRQALDTMREAEVQARLKLSELESRFSLQSQQLEAERNQYQKYTQDALSNYEHSLAERRSLEIQIQDSQAHTEAMQAECQHLKRTVENLTAASMAAEEGEQAAKEEARRADQTITKLQAAHDTLCVEAAADKENLHRHETELEKTREELRMLSEELHDTSVEHVKCNATNENLIRQLAAEREEAERNQASLLSQLDQQEEHIQASLRRDRGLQWEQRQVSEEMKAYDAAVSAERKNAENTGRLLQSLEADHASLKSTTWAREETLRQEVHRLKQSAVYVAAEHVKQMELLREHAARSAHELVSYKAATLLTQEATMRDVIAKEQQTEMHPMLIHATLASTRTLLKKKRPNEGHQTFRR